jgi:hypothetical protein
MRAVAQKIAGSTSFSMEKDSPSLSMVRFAFQGKPLRFHIFAEGSEMPACSSGALEQSSGFAECRF